MRIIFAYAVEFPEAMAAMREHYPAAEFHRLDTETAYFELLAGAWDASRPFSLVEQDNLVRAGLLEELWACPNPHCGFPYRMGGGGFNAAWGCTKFSAELIEATDGIWEYIAEHGHEVPFQSPTGDPRHWLSLDGRWAYAATRIFNCGSICTHWPAIPHLNPDYQRPGVTPEQDAATSPHPPVHRCGNGHACHCHHGEGHSCPIRESPGGTSGALVHNMGRFG